MPDISALDIAAVLSLIGVVLCLAFGGRVRYTYHPTVKDWRYCHTCGQQQSLETVGEEEIAAWKTVGAIKNHNCNCHNDTL